MTDHTPCTFFRQATPALHKIEQIPLLSQLHDNNKERGHEEDSLGMGLLVVVGVQGGHPRMAESRRIYYAPMECMT